MTIIIKQLQAAATVKLQYIPSRMVTIALPLSPAELEAVMLTMCISLYDRVRVAISV